MEKQELLKRGSFPAPEASPFLLFYAFPKILQSTAMALGGLGGHHFEEMAKISSMSIHGTSGPVQWMFVDTWLQADLLIMPLLFYILYIFAFINL